MRLVGALIAAVLLGGCGSVHNTLETQGSAKLPEPFAQFEPHSVKSSGTLLYLGRARKAYGAHRLTGSQLDRLMREVQNLCHEKHLSCAEAHAAFGSK
jgi:hypothetical protein